MTGSLWHLALASILFVGSHFVMSSGSIRPRLVSAMGRAPFMIGYSIFSLMSFAWMLWAYQDAPDVVLWIPMTGFKHASLTLMLFACFFIVGGYTTQNPGAINTEDKAVVPSPKGVLKITRHPVMWGIAFWGIAHLLAHGEVAKLILFGTMTVLALAGAYHIDLRRRQNLGDAWRAYEAETSFFPLGAILKGRTRIENREIPLWQTLLTVLLYIGLLYGHNTVLGVNVLPL
ncbi:MAG: NnrU family protein [Rhodospirillales bacterium]|nr:NnrU family protein [Rhodospirillales bacterium]MBT3907598.1 NnrU family protein [Rhodospirillaceae bacterium]MBT5033111.1 NnrU family protein [Rhodospirillaceae bacterium]MBT6219919.1 NnrU family protein [Rhodospirillaceae bacterium]MBT6362425.1 NnrU family protein [Rhodospirillaceae bacterium]